MHEMIKEIKEVLLDPEDGLIVRVNKNTFWRKEIDADEFKALIRWKQSVTHAMWVVYSALVGIILKLIFWT
jgi:flagellar biosynthesis/type III secretory pathway M-ring protein FliF/YscJ